MRKNLTEVVFILDRSGSMSGLEKDTIGGFNSMIEKQKREAGQALISTVLFNNNSKVLYDRVEVQKIPSMTEDDYSVYGVRLSWMRSAVLSITLEMSTNMHARKMYRSIPFLSS